MGLLTFNSTDYQLNATVNNEDAYPSPSSHPAYPSSEDGMKFDKIPNFKLFPPKLWAACQRRGRAFSKSLTESSTLLDKEGGSALREGRCRRAQIKPESAK